MKLDLITLATVKTQLGITDSTYDSDITAMIPIVSNDVRVIMNTNYDEYVLATVTSGSAVISSFKKLDLGQVVYSPAIPDDTYVKSYDPDTGLYTLSASATDDGYYIYITIQMRQWPAISSMIMYKIGNQTVSAATSKSLKAVKYGNVSKTFAEDEINTMYGYPNTYVLSLGIPYQRVR